MAPGPRLGLLCSFPVSLRSLGLLPWVPGCSLHMGQVLGQLLAVLRGLQLLGAACLCSGSLAPGVPSCGPRSLVWGKHQCYTHTQEGTGPCWQEPSVSSCCHGTPGLCSIPCILGRSLSSGRREEAASCLLRGGGGAQHPTQVSCYGTGAMRWCWGVSQGRGTEEALEPGNMWAGGVFGT